jgi:hypothetical protein
MHILLFVREPIDSSSLTAEVRRVHQRQPTTSESRVIEVGAGGVGMRTADMACVHSALLTRLGTSADYRLVIYTLSMSHSMYIGVAITRSS